MLVCAAKHDPGQAVKLLEADWRRGVARAEPHDRRFDLRRRAEVALAYFHDVLYARVELYIGR